ncbi:pyrroloquinoline quinone biosynthesis protein PqqE [Nitrospira sp. Nam74]
MSADCRPYTMIAELTYRCPLQCLYCSNPVDYRDSHDELETTQWLTVFRQAEALGIVHLNLTGGEPLLREDLESLIAEAHRLELYTHLVTSGIPLTHDRLIRLAAAGLRSIQLSIQSLQADGMTRMTGGPWLEHKSQVAAWIKEINLPLTINMVLHRDNLSEIADMIVFAERLGAHRLELANVQYLGWALRNRDVLLPTKSQLEAARVVALDARDRLRGCMDVVFVWPDYYREFPKSCMDGWGRRSIVIAADGVALPCHMARSLDGAYGLSFPNVKNTRLDTIWHASSGFNRFRGDEWMGDPCRSCSRRSLDHGGCRCQAFHLAGNPADTDPACHLAPSHHLIEAARVRAETMDLKPVTLHYRRVTA